MVIVKILTLITGSIRVYCRVQPFLPGQPSRFSTVATADNGVLTLITPSKNGKEGQKSFTYNQVFGPSAIQGRSGPQRDALS